MFNARLMNADALLYALKNVENTPIRDFPTAPRAIQRLDGITAFF